MSPHCIGMVSNHPTCLSDIFLMSKRSSLAVDQTIVGHAPPSRAVSGAEIHMLLACSIDRSHTLSLLGVYNKLLAIDSITAGQLCHPRDSSRSVRPRQTVQIGSRLAAPKFSESRLRHRKRVSSRLRAKFSFQIRFAISVVTIIVQHTASQSGPYVIRCDRGHCTW